MTAAHGRGRPRKYNYREVGRAYEEAVARHEPPLKYIADALGISHKAAERVVHRARREGFVPPPGPMLWSRPVRETADALGLDPKDMLRRLSEAGVERVQFVVPKGVGA